ncbi:MAG: rod shape-determining protein MreC [Phycisphaeraceae bacterium]
MRRSLLTPKRLLVLLAVLFLFSSFLGERTAGRLSHAPRAMVNTLVSPARWSAHALSLRLRREEPDPVAWDRQQMSRAELEELYGRRLRELRDLQRRHRDLRERLAQLQQIQSLAERSEQWDFSGVRYVQARVTGLTGAPNAPTLNIARGTRAGIREGAIIVRGYNLVGRVVHAGPATSEVKLITAPQTKLQATLLPPADATDSRDSLPVQLEVRDDGETFGVQVRRGEPVQAGDLAHLDDPRFPREAQSYIVGQVISVQRAPDDPYLFQEIVVKPILPLTGLSEVTALVPVE